MLPIEPVFKAIAKLFSDDNHDAYVGLPSANDLKMAVGSARGTEIVRQDREADDTISINAIAGPQNEFLPKEFLMPSGSKELTESEKTNRIAPAGDSQTQPEITNKETEGATVGQSTEQGQTEYPARWKLACLIVGLSATCFALGFDSFMIATAIPTITADFGSVKYIGWYGSSYLLTVTTFKPFFTYLDACFGIKYSCIISLILWMLGSGVCGGAVSPIMLIIGRAVAGAGASNLVSGIQNILVHSAYPKHHRLCRLMIGVVSMIASVVAPLIGGSLTANVSWRFCFWVNHPLVSTNSHKLTHSGYHSIRCS